MEEKIKPGIKDFEVYCENDEYFARITYIEERKDGFYSVYFPKVCLGITNDRYWYTNLSLNTLHIGDNSYLLLPGMVGYAQAPSLIREGLTEPKEQYGVLKETLIKEKVHEMTLEEIEKKLGYKVKVVTKKGENL